ncbi:MAG: hypothetical protein Q9181_005446 [Wetmoreana brouardii]
MQISLPGTMDEGNLQPGLGMLTKLPLEIRLMIWQQFVPRTESSYGDLDRASFYPCSTPSPSSIGSLSILRASKQLHQEITEEIHRHTRDQTLTVCLSHQHHDFYLHRESGIHTMFYVTVGDTCRLRDLDCTDFSKYKSINLNIKQPMNLTWVLFRPDSEDETAFDNLKIHVHGFIQFIRAWHLRRIKRSLPSCPVINVRVNPCPEEDYRGNRWWYHLENFMKLFKPPRSIKNGPIASGVEFKSRCRQHWPTDLEDKVHDWALEYNYHGADTFWADAEERFGTFWLTNESIDP